MAVSVSRTHPERFRPSSWYNLEELFHSLRRVGREVSRWGEVIGGEGGEQVG